MTHPTDSHRDETVSQAHQTYRDVLAKWGLQKFTQQELNRARTKLRAQRRAHVGLEDVEFQAALTRLQSAKRLPARTVEGALKELLDAEYEYDQAQWERDCHLAAVKEHSKFRTPD